METLSLDGKNFVKTKSAARELGYTPDYIGQLCRSGKIDAKLVGRSWYVDVEQLRSHKKRRYGAKGTKNIKRAVNNWPAKSSGSKTLTLTKTPTIEHRPTPSSPNFRRYVLWSAPRYETDENELMPAVGKEFTTGGGIKVTVKPTDAETIEVREAPGPSYSMSATDLPEVRLKGVLKVNSAEENYDPEIDTPAENATPELEGEVRQLTNAEGVIGMKKRAVKVRPAGKPIPTQTLRKRLTPAVIPVKADAQGAPPEVIEIKVSMVPYVASAFVLAAFTLTVLFGMNAVVTSTEFVTRQTFDFNLANLIQYILGDK